MSEPVQPAPAFSLRAEQELSRTLEQYCRVPGQEQESALTPALSRLCSEAHDQSLGPEQMLKAVKMAWARVPRAPKESDEARALAWEGLEGVHRVVLRPR